MTTSTPNTCQKCGKPILDGSPRGLCPLCLISAVAKTDGPVPSDAPSPELDDLRTVFPQLEILEPLGAGGMGRVYKVRQPNLDRVVALKLLPPAYAADPEWIERFTREARALARLNHPHIVQVYDFGETAANERGERFPFLLMEFVDGVNLRQALRTGALTAREALTIVPSVCSALQYAHDQGVLHRDIKPENILLDTLGRVKIADFGLAKLRGDSAPGLTLTATGAQLGTAAYMAPEQIEKPHDVDHRADIYSLGVVFYELLTGELPLGRFPAPSEKSGTDPRLDTIVFRTLEKERDRRFQTATDMRTEVENVANHPAPEPPPKVSPDEWMIRCASCGRTATLASVGGIRIGAASIGKRALIRCSQCGGLREGIIAQLRDLPPGTVPVAPGSLTLEAENKPRLSKMAVAGTILVAVGIFFIVATFLALGLILPQTWNAHDNVGVSSPWVRTLLPILIGLVGLLPALAGTICGWIGLAQIRASAGALRGAGRATFAALFYPALLLIPFIGVLCGRTFGTGLVAIVGFIFAIVATAWIARTLCRHAERAPENTAPRPVRWPWLIGFAALGCVILLPVLALVIPYFATRSWQESAILTGRTMTDVVTRDRASFTAFLPHGIVELVGVSRYPARPDSWWKMDGSPAAAPDLEIIKADRDPKPGERSLAFVFKMSELPESTKLLDWEVENSEGWTVGNANNLLTKDGQMSGLVHVTARLPATLRATDLRAGFGFGEWTTILESGTQSVGGATPEHDGVRWKLGWSAATETKDNRIVINWNAPRIRDWETRVVAVKKDGTTVATDDHTTGQDQTEWRFSGVAMSDLMSFGFQVRPVYWMEFRGIQLAPNSLEK